MESPSNNTEGKSDQFDGAVTFNVAQNDPVGKYLFEIDSSDVMMGQVIAPFLGKYCLTKFRKSNLLFGTLKKVEKHLST